MSRNRELQVLLRLLREFIEQHLHQAVHCRFSEFGPAALGHNEDKLAHQRRII